MTPGCSGAHRARGVCDRCYCALTRLIESGRETPESLVAKGRWRAKRKWAVKQFELPRGVGEKEATEYLVAMLRRNA